jgi:sarcosine oxidase subunit beta
MKTKEADVVIMGGGITGCSLAYRLAEKGKHVILLDKGRVGEEASGRNGGGVRQQNRDAAELPMAMEAVKIWSAMKDELECDVDYRNNGNLRLVTTEEELNRLPRKWEQDLGLHVEILTPEETRAIVPAISKDIELYGGTFCPTDGTANPLLATKAIARAAQRKGVEIKEHEPVTGLELKGGLVSAAYTQAGEYRASTFVNSAGPWAKIICNWVGLDLPLDVRRGQVVVSEPLPPLIKPFMSFGFYLRQTLEGHIHFGVSSQPVENFDKHSTLFAFETVGQRFMEVFPCLRKANVIRTWAGLTAWTPDEKPILDRAPGIDNFYLAAGFSAHGFCLGPSAGKQIAELIVDGKSSLDLSPFRWSRFERIHLNES